MKRCGILLLTIIFLTYGYKGYKVYDDYINDVVKVKESGALSDISNNVIPVNLKGQHIADVQQIRKVQKDGNNIFLLSEDKLLHFDINGNFLNYIASDISDNEESFIASYTIDSDKHQIIVIDSSRNICKYNYNGKLISKLKITHSWNKMTAFTYHKGYLWATAETIEKHDDNSLWVVNNLYKLDTDMNEISRDRLHPTEKGRDILFESLHAHEILVDEQGVYAYRPPVDMKYLLDDTLNILYRNSTPMKLLRRNYHEQASLYPVRKSKHFMISTFYNTQDDHYTFCYDKSNNTAYMLQKGFKDDFYNTGYITDLQPVDNNNSTYCYINSSDEKAVLYIVTLKS
jgi:hypothetical protein